MKVSETHGGEGEPKKFCHFPEGKEGPRTGGGVQSGLQSRAGFV